MTGGKNPEEIKDNQKTQGTVEETKTEATGNTEAALLEEKSRAETYLDNWKRTQADFINYKRRSEQEKEDTIKFGNTMLLLELLPVLDDLQRALESVPEDISEVPWVEGIRLIERKFNKCLESQGVTIIKTVGEKFDPKLHEAVQHVDGEDGMIIQELRKGYKLYDRVIRPAMVAVGNGKQSE
jgi:molecular chaperone GrpE